MKRALTISVGILSIAAGTALAQMAAPGYAPGVSLNGEITVPKNDYRKDWAYLGSFATNGENGVSEFHNVYTQPETVAAYRETGAFPDGAVLLKELIEAQTEDLTTGNISYATKPKGWFVMVKDSKGRFSGNPLWGDGWGWALFGDNPDETVTTSYVDECLGCHEPARDTDLSYVRGYPSLTGPGR